MSCEATAQKCRCDVDGDHNLHECVCGGSWRGSSIDAPDFEAVTFPRTVVDGPYAGADVLSVLFGGLDINEDLS